MVTQYDRWLRALGSRRRDLECDRYMPFVHPIHLQGDWTTFTIEGAIKATPDASEELKSFDVDPPVFEDGFTTFMVFLAAGDTLGLPPANGTGRVDVIYDIVLFDAARVAPRRLFGGLFTVIGFVTESI